MEDVMKVSPLRLAKKNITAYFTTHDPKYIAEDAVYINTASGERAVGREAIGKLLHDFYHIAFEGKPRVTSQIITEDKAVIEGVYMGKHVGEYAGLPATGKTVTLPFCVSYTLENGLIKEARIYSSGDLLFRQLQDQDGI